VKNDDLAAFFAETGFQTLPAQLRCPYCIALPGEGCVTSSGKPAVSFHSSRPNDKGFTGRDAQGKQYCLACGTWENPAAHSC
jgi:hypothetical protein